MSASPNHRSRSRFTGLRAWWVQRASAVCMLVFLIFVLVSMAVHPLAGHAQWRAWVAHPGITLAFLLFFAALLSHMWVGLRDVLLDYAKPTVVRNVLLALVALGLFGLGVWALVILLRLHS
ncbi:succinate dehydrogenase, hydrophobic membrane anchor protein [Candidatus Aalborgicola defluviihabitans]|jgi:succinate dehydrogenase / fumarate reductase membrane anchor subunit|uniref:succinate dehydrogenase, hydrophobic membrane anchor protein n=1 Tax=Candidatus Aalborgicola defluviihabitans TaxID=3386187 RepID=UPI001D7280C2|nr:succinate dehydrogenase, hydrophobic membrane anchor protein [Burkholderiales bacterium]MBK6568887.1 succinate dehydrogenase, hydrophobic membrane anchor protein [Burkholderiales bacterium]MBK7281040.1 succinate dehydrogenase, hydrophobic membrane anchor protein [Burkholderiales bacterium]MBK7313717.1 succinate dehydrogenase, hydrophobic membrane anchor protein [Burkholderiales bacterium]MBL0245541.1 succinate dehydrogenase, hydrophobic membrane anchor protein [Rhodoferax sp.]